MVGVCFWHVFKSAENEFVVKKIIKNHGNTGGETEDAGGFDKIVVKWDVEIRADIMNKFVKWCDETEKPGKKWADGDGGDAVPNEEQWLPSYLGAAAPARVATARPWPA